MVFSRQAFCKKKCNLFTFFSVSQAITPQKTTEHTENTTNFIIWFSSEKSNNFDKNHKKHSF